MERPEDRESDVTQKVYETVDDWVDPPGPLTLPVLPRRHERVPVGVVPQQLLEAPHQLPVLPVPLRPVSVVLDTAVVKGERGRHTPEEVLVPGLNDRHVPLDAVSPASTVAVANPGSRTGGGWTPSTTRHTAVGPPDVDSNVASEGLATLPAPSSSHVVYRPSGHV